MMIAIFVSLVFAASGVDARPTLLSRAVPSVDTHVDDGTLSSDDTSIASRKLLDCSSDDYTKYETLSTLLFSTHRVHALAVAVLGCRALLKFAFHFN
jgi:hypothetical protein